MKRDALNKILQASRFNLKNRPLGSAEPPEDKEAKRALVDQAIAKGVIVKVCPPRGKKPDLRKRPRGY